MPAVLFVIGVGLSLTSCGLDRDTAIGFAGLAAAVGGGLFLAWAILSEA